jgi:hypothetical protein
VRIDPHGMFVVSEPIVPTPGDGDDKCGVDSETKIRRFDTSTRRKIVQVPLCPYHKILPGIAPGLARREVGN